MKITIDQRKQVLKSVFNTPEGKTVFKNTLYEMVSEMLFGKLVAFLDSGIPNAVDLVVDEIIDSISLNEDQEVLEARLMNIGGVA